MFSNLRMYRETLLSFFRGSSADEVGAVSEAFLLRLECKARVGSCNEAYFRFAL